MIRSIGVISRCDLKEAVSLSASIHRFLASRGFKVYLEPSLAEALGLKDSSLPIEKMYVDFILILGGDGLILKTVSLLPKPETPILTVNFGTVGFLAEVSPDEVFKALDKVFIGEYRLEVCTKIGVALDSERLPDALNEVLIITSKPSKVINIALLKDEAKIYVGRADGVIISTKTGSTAYILSAKGPVLDPDVDAFVVAFICPLRLDACPLVLPTSSVIKAKLLEGPEALVVVDGHTQSKLKVGGEVVLKRSPSRSSFIRFKDSFYERLSRRLRLEV